MLRTYEDLQDGGPSCFDEEALMEQIKIRDTYINALRNEIISLTARNNFIGSADEALLLDLCKKTVYQFEIDNKTKDFLESKHG